MDLNKSSKIVLGVLTFLPLLVAVSFLGFIVINFLSVFFSQEPVMPMMLFSYLSYIIPYIFPIFLLALGLFVFYIVHIIKNPLLDTEKRILWTVVVFLAYGVAIPTYWYIHVWKNTPSKVNKADHLTDDYDEPGTRSQKL